MTPKSPLGAIGAVLVLIQAISAGALLAVRSIVGLQIALVCLIGAVTVALTILVIWLIHFLAKTNPALLFSPRDIHSSAHLALYAHQQENLEVALKPNESTQTQKDAAQKAV